MRRIIIILEFLNAGMGIFVNILNLNNIEFLGIPTQWWNISIFILFFIGIFVIYQSNESMKQELFGKLKEELSQSNNAVEPQEKSIDNTTYKEHLYIMQLNTDMLIAHGHLDYHGLIADYVDCMKNHGNIGDLMIMNCKRCGKPRNQRSE
jgi:ABC-type nickel/cobalt efflux system permease component RcnA